MSERVIVLGGSGIGMSVASIVNDDPKAEMVGFLNDYLPVGSLVGKYKKYPVIGTTDDIGMYMQQDDVKFFIAYVGMQQEKTTFEKIESLNIPPEKLYSAIHESAIFPKEFCSIGKGVLLTALSQVGVDVTLSDNCMLLANSYVGHDSFLDKFAHVATNAVVGANVHVGKGVHVGSNATIREKIKIGDYSLIGAGAVVVSDVPENCIVVGNPARVLRMK